MIVARETIMAALFARLQTAVLGANPAFKGAQRKWTAINQVNQAQRPFLIMLEDDERLLRPRAGMPPGRLIMAAQVQIYFWTSGLEAPATPLNNMLDAVQKVMDPSPGANGIRQQTLGGLTYDAWIEGRIVKVPGYQDGNGLLLLPISILVP